MKSSNEKHAAAGTTIIVSILVWALLYNLIVKEQALIPAALQIVDTITEDLVMGSMVTVSVGLGIVLVFTLTKLYTQIISVAASFRMIEVMIDDLISTRDAMQFLKRLAAFEDEPEPQTVYPERVSSILIAFSLLYVMSWTYLVLFSEALFFVSWSAGVDLPITIYNIELLPTLALSIPFSARIMAYFRYPYTQDYADFMPGAVFVLLLVGALGYMFQSDDQQFFLQRVWENKPFLNAFLSSGLMLAFVPVFAEAVFWMLNVFSDEAEESKE